jgi:hypothetical protein
MGLYLNNFHLPCHIHLYRLHRVKLSGDLRITKRKMGASGCGLFQVNIVEFGCAKWERPRNALFNVVDFGLKFCGTVANVARISIRDSDSRVTYPHWVVTALGFCWLVSITYLMHNSFFSTTIYMLHYNPRYISSINMPIFRRTNCIIAESGIVTSVNGCTVCRMRADCSHPA